MARPPIVAQPPHDDAPVTADGQHSQAWTGYHQTVADALSKLAAQQGVGVTDGTAAAAGKIGEYLTATFGSSGLSNNVAADLGTLALTAGDWDVRGYATFTSSATALRGVFAWVGNAAVTPNQAAGIAVANMGTGTALWTGPQRFSGAGAMTAYLGVMASFSAGTAAASGFIAARRVR